jgi:predicted transcriptional regulator
MEIRDFCDRTVLALERNVPIYDAIRWLDDYDAEHAVLMGDDDPERTVVGVVDRKTLADALLSRADPDETTVADITCATPLILHYRQHLEQAIESMDKAGECFAVVVDENGALFGTLLLSDITMPDTAVVS